MTSNAKKTTKWKLIVLVGLLVLVVLGIAGRKVESGNPEAASKTFTQTTFASPAEAGAALDKAAKTNNHTALSQILGVETKRLLTTGDSEVDMITLAAFASKYDQMNRWVDMTDGSRVLYIGADNFAFPVPLAENSSGRWYFDAVAGAQEVRARDIGRNELLAIDACYSLADAEEIYYATVGASPEYPRRIISTSGKQDGLYWPVSQTQTTSPLGNLTEFPKASFGSFPPQEPLAIDGYTLRILTAQGDSAPGGAKSYIVNGKMTGGFAILAAPIKYGETGIMTFMISREGVVYEQDLGPDTAKIAASTQEYDPDEYWWPVE
jgi:Protein of unknown function (DUF2950)